MRVLIKPQLSARDVFTACISNIRDNNLKTRLENIANIIEQQAINFDTEAQHGRSFSISAHTAIGNVSGGEMKALYKNKMAKKNQPGRPYYDILLALPKHGLCPLCGQRTVSTLDHYLAQTHYASLVVNPHNLVAACSDCNKTKRDIIATLAEDQTLHPYYDDVTSDTWLFAEVIEGNPVALRFFVNPPQEWDETLKARIRAHFLTFKLGALYSAHAGSELVNQKEILESLLRKAGSERVKEQMEDYAQSHQRVHFNSWQAAMFSALAQSDWYCGGGLLNV